MFGFLHSDSSEHRTIGQHASTHDLSSAIHNFQALCTCQVQVVAGTGPRFVDADRCSATSDVVTTVPSEFVSTTTVIQTTAGTTLGTGTAGTVLTTTAMNIPTGGTTGGGTKNGNRKKIESH